jgi:hypothetical protein
VRKSLAVLATLGCVAALTGCGTAAHASTSTTAELASANPTLAQAKKFTQCMRAHGVRAFPEPAMVDRQIVFAGAPGIGREPKFLSAQNACSYLLGGKPTGGHKSG